MNEKNRSHRASPAGIIIASICICLYLAALASAGIRIYLHIEKQRDTAVEEFGYIADLADSAGILGFMDERFIATIQDALQSSRTLEGLIISGPNGEYPFEKNPGQAINTVNNMPRFKNRFDFSRQPLYMPLQIQNLRNVNIEARASSVDYGEVSIILKQALFMVLASLLISFFTLLIQTLLDKSTDKSGGAEGRPDLPRTAFPENKPENISTEELDTDPENELANEAVTNPGNDLMKDLLNDLMNEPENNFDNELADEPDDDPEYETEDKPEYSRPGQTGGIKTGSAAAPDLPKGLYSPRGNIGWEDYTKSRLESELMRCAANEQDLAYMVMEFKDLNVMDQNFYLSFAEDAVIFFAMRDMIFEKGDRGITVILPNMELNTALVKADEFHDRCLHKYGQVFKSKTDLCIGISARSGRLIDAERLMFEANEALAKALSDPSSHTIAFKSDPEKYRAYIASRNSGSIN